MIILWRKIGGAAGNSLVAVSVRKTCIKNRDSVVDKNGDKHMSGWCATFPADIIASCKRTADPSTDMTALPWEFWAIF